MTTLLFALLLVFYQLLLSSGDYELQVAIHFLSNPRGRTATRSSCDGDSGRNPQCEYFFYICQRPAESPVSTVLEENQGNCSAEHTQIYKVDNGTQMSFEPALKFLATGNEWVNEGVQVFVDLVDYDINRDNDLVDRFAINVTQSVASSTRNRYSGIFSTAELIISLTLQCTGTYECGRFCNETCIAVLQITIHSFSISEGRCADLQCSSESRCCDSICPQNQCQYSLRYSVSNEQAKYQENCSAVNLTQSFSLSRKLSFPLMQLAPQEIQLFIELMHFSRDNEVNGLIERFIVNISSTERVRNFYSGIFGLANISMTTEIICRPEIDHCILNEVTSLSSTVETSNRNLISVALPTVLIFSVFAVLIIIILVQCWKMKRKMKSKTSVVVKYTHGRHGESFEIQTLFLRSSAINNTTSYYRANNTECYLNYYSEHYDLDKDDKAPTLDQHQYVCKDTSNQVADNSNAYEKLSGSYSKPQEAEKSLVVYAFTKDNSVDDDNEYDYETPYWEPADKKMDLLHQLKKLRIKNVAQEELE